MEIESEPDPKEYLPELQKVAEQVGIEVDPASRVHQADALAIKLLQYVIYVCVCTLYNEYMCVYMGLALFLCMGHNSCFKHHLAIAT